jgi:hypothetical protein
LRPHLPRMRPVDFLEMLLWKLTSPLPMPYQPTVLLY